YLPLLQDIVFDPSVLKTKKDNWNYYGERISNWLPILTDLLTLAKVKLDVPNKRLIFEEVEEYSDSSADFLPYSFGDIFLDYMRKEANECFQQKHYLATMFLSRKIAETILSRVMEIVFPKIVTGTYNETNHVLWYDKNRGRSHGFGVILENLKIN